MSFHPIQQGFSSSLLGIADPVKFVDPSRIDTSLLDKDSTADKSLTDRRIHAGRDKTQTIRYTLIIIVISAIIFVTVIAIYDVLRIVITNFYAKAALTDPKAQVTPTDLTRTLIANYESFLATLVFALIAIFLALILIPILIWLL